MTGVVCATAENSGLLKKIKKEKRTAVKLKAVPTTSGCLIILRVLYTVYMH